MIIDAVYDPSVTALNSTLQANFESAVDAAIQYYEQTISTNITVTIDFGYGEVDGQTVSSSAVSESVANYMTVSYSQLRAAALAVDTSSSVQQAAAKLLPATDPTYGAGSFDVNLAQLKALGLPDPYFGAPDGYVGLNSSLSYSWSQSSVASGTYDAVGALEHEISEVLGRSADLGVNNQYSLLDFYRYTAANGGSTDAPGSAAGVLDEPFAPGYNSNTQAYFSYNGATITLPYDTAAQVRSGDDVADWTNSVNGDSYGFAFKGVVGAVSQTDLEELNVLGYAIANKITETTPATLSGNWNTAISLKTSVSVSSPSGPAFLDNQANLTTVLTVGDRGALYLANAEGATVTGAGTWQVTIKGTVAEINAALANAYYEDASYVYGSDSIAVTTTDAYGQTSGTNTIAVTVNPIPETLTESAPNTLSVNWNSPIAISGLAVTETPGDPNEILTAALSSSNGAITVSPVTGGATFGRNGTGSVTLTGTVAQIDAALANVTYTSNPYFHGVDYVGFTTTDSGGDNSGTSDIAVTVNAVAETITQTTPGSLSGDWNAPIALADLGVSETPVEPGNVVTTTLAANKGDIVIGSASGAAVQGNQTNSVALTGTIAQINAALATASYEPNAYAYGADTISVTTTDAGGDTSGTNAIAVTIDKIPETITETGPTSLSGSWVFPISLDGLSVAETPANAGFALTTTLTANDGTIEISAANGATIGGNATGAVTMTGTLAQINAALATASYQANANYIGSDTISVTTADAGGDTSGASQIVVTVSTLAQTTFSHVASAGALSQDIAEIDLESKADGGTGTHFTISLSAGATLTEAADLEAVNLAGDDTLTLNGAGATLDGGGAYRGLFVYSGLVTVDDLTIADAAAIGGSGGAGYWGAGGGGAGLGGGLYLADDSADGAAPAEVTLEGVSFATDSAVGGAGGSDAANNTSSSGGGGLGGNGGAGAGGGGGGIGANASGETTNGANGIVEGAGGGGAAGDGYAGGASGGAGGSSAEGGGGGVDGAAGSLTTGGGAGGYGGGGGGALGGVQPTFGGGAGGFGGGGGGGLFAAGHGGFGGGGASAFMSYAPGGFGAGSARFGGGGGGGLGAGGAIFVQGGATLTIDGGSLSGGSVVAGQGSNGSGNGQAFGSGIFLQGDEDLSFDPAAGQTETISDVIADMTGSHDPSGQLGVGSLTMAGQGALALDAANTFTGGVTLKAGTLSLGDSAGAGTGAITFSSGAQATLDIANGTDPTNAIVGFGAGDAIDLLGLANSYLPTTPGSADPSSFTLAIQGDVVTQTNSDGSKLVSTFDIAGQNYTSSALAYGANGLMQSALYQGVTGEGNLSSFEYLYSGAALIGSNLFYSFSGAPYAGAEYDYDGGGALTRAAFTGATGAGYSAYEFDYVGGVFSGSRFTVAAVPAGASYSSYELDFNAAGGFAGYRFFVAGGAGQAYSSLELDFSASAYVGYKVFYSGQTGGFAGEEVDVNAAGQLAKVIYSGVTGANYSSVEQDYLGGVLADTVYSFNNLTGASYHAYQVEESASGALMTTTYDMNDGRHALVGAANSLTIEALGNDDLQGGGSGETFLLPAIYGHDTISDFATYSLGADHDTISFAQSEFSNFAAVQAAAVSSGGNTVISASDGDRLTLLGVTALTSAMSADFAFRA